MSAVSLNYNHMGAYQTVPSDFGNLCSFSDGTIRFWKFAFMFGRYRPTSKTASVFGQYCPTSETCVNFRIVLSDFGNLRPFSNSTARLQTPASILRQYRKTSNFSLFYETFCSRTTWVNYSFTIILKAFPDSYSKIPQLKVPLLLTTGIIPSNNLSCDRKTFMTGFISTIICCGLVLFVDVVRGRL